MVDNYPIYIHWAMHSDEQMINGWPFSPLNDEQMSKKVRVEHHRENPVQNVNLQKAGQMIATNPPRSPHLRWFVRESPPVWGHHLISKWRWITFPRTYPSSSMNSGMSLDVEKLLQWVKSWDESEDFELGEFLQKPQNNIGQDWRNHMRNYPHLQCGPTKRNMAEI